MTARLSEQLSNLRAQKMNEELAIARVEEAYERGRYSEEKMAEKLEERSGEIAQIDQKMQEIEDQLRVASSVDVEVKKLRDAAAQVKYRLQNLDRRQKKILCNLFIDRIEMRRRKVHERWKVHADVFFRFNPQKFSEEIEQGRAPSGLAKATKGALKSKNVVDGGR